MENNANKPEIYKNLKFHNMSKLKTKWRAYTIPTTRVLIWVKFRGISFASPKFENFYGRFLSSSTLLAFMSL